ncbi:LysR substrate-binding domain-containing protein [Ottowia sp.]|uniref:LysR family transcriptional regulator n=1 Tax=Ottowia sp. TaxID=1898956 RepID=UPI003A85EF1B
MDSSHRIRAIVSFVQTTDSGSFAAAARALGISAAAVSKNVASLEQALGVRLLHRTTRTLSLTAEGTAFLHRARVALDALDQAVDAVAAQRAQPVGQVRISSSQAFGVAHLMPALPPLLAQYPGLSVEVDFDDRVIDLVHSGYDMALRGGHIEDSALVSRPVCRFKLILVASPAYLSAHGVPRTPDDLHTHRLIARRFLGGRVMPWALSPAQEQGQNKSVPFDVSNHATLTLSAPEAALQAALNGAGITQTALHLAWPHLKAGTLKMVLHPQFQPGDYELVMQYPHRALMAPRVRVTLDHLSAAFAKDEALHVPLAEAARFAAS